MFLPVAVIGFFEPYYVNTCTYFVAFFFLYHVLQDCSVGTVVESLTILTRATEDSKFFCSAGPSGLWNHILADQIPGHIVRGTQVPGHLVLCNRVIDTHVKNIPYMFSSLMA